MPLPEPDVAKGWVGKTVVDRDDAEIGVCTAVLADGATGVPEWMYADVGGVSVVVPLVDASQAGDRVRVTVSRADVDSAPPVTDSPALSDAQEVELYQHYGLEYSRAPSGKLLPVSEAEPSGPAPEARVDQPNMAGAGERSRQLAGVLAVLAGLGLIVVAALRRRAPVGPTRKRGKQVKRVARALRRRAPVRPARKRRKQVKRVARRSRATAVSAAPRERMKHVAASVAPLTVTTSELMRRGTRVGASSARRAAATAAERARAAWIAANAGTASFVASAVPVLVTAGQVARRATSAGAVSARDAAGETTRLAAAAVSRTAARGADIRRAGLRAGLGVMGAAEAVPQVVSESSDQLQKGWKRVMGKTSFGLGLGAGYIVGARAGRARFEQIRQAAVSFTERPEVQQALDQALEKVKAAAPQKLQSTIDSLSRRTSGVSATSSPEPGGTDTTGSVDMPPLPDTDPVLAETDTVTVLEADPAVAPEPFQTPGQPGDRPGGRP